MKTTAQQKVKTTFRPLIDGSQSQHSKMQFTNFCGDKSFCRIRNNVYLKVDGRKFLSAKGYLSYIRKGIRMIGQGEYIFFSEQNIEKVIIWRNQFKRQYDYRAHDRTIGKIIYSFDAYIEFLKFYLLSIPTKGYEHAFKQAA